MTIDEARNVMADLCCRGEGNTNRPLAWLTMSGRRAVGFTDGELRYTMGVADTWEEAVERAKRNGRGG